MRRFFEPLLLLSGFTLAYAWVQSAALKQYSLQIIALGIILFFVLKRISRSRLHHVLPQPDTLEATILALVVSLGVGSTGGLNSPFLPVYYLLLFVFVLTLSWFSHLVALVGICLFLWATTAQPVGSTQLLELIALPFLLPLMLFARMQFDEAKDQKYLAEQEEILLDEQEIAITAFLQDYLHPKMQTLRVALETSPENIWMVRRQLELLEKESQELLLKTHRFTIEKMQKEQEISK